MNNILDKVIKSQEEKIKSNLDLEGLVNFLLKDLNQRERVVLKARYGLSDNNIETLDSIGKRLDITRERVRQIQKSALDKARQTPGASEKMTDLVNLIDKNLSNHGHIRLEKSLFEDMLSETTNKEIGYNCLTFIFEEFLKEHVEQFDVVYAEKAWALKDKKCDHYPLVVEKIKDILENKKIPLGLSEIIVEIKNYFEPEKINEFLREIYDFEKAVHSCLEISKHFKKNIFDKWGLSHWRLVSPKRMRDKIFLILSKHGRPLHYRDIADKINEEHFDSKFAHPPTIHNELILDNRFVLIGRGIYALVNWGYKPGTISDVIIDIFKKNNNQPMSKNEISTEVLKSRVVKKGSINLALTNKDLFFKTSAGKYILK